VSINPLMPFEFAFTTSWGTHRFHVRKSAWNKEKSATELAADAGGAVSPPFL
jgi:hypothetical protein